MLAMTSPTTPPPGGEAASTVTTPSGAARRRPARHSAAASLWAADGAWDLPDVAPRTSIRDSLYDLIPLGQLELALIDTPEFVRLQGVKQLGFVLSRLARRDPHALRAQPGRLLSGAAGAARAAGARRGGAMAGSAAAPTDLRTLLAAALLHDIGHYPFSHAIEELGQPIAPHERVGRRIIEGGAVAEVLERHGLDPGARGRSDRPAARDARAARPATRCWCGCSAARSMWTSSTTSRATPAPATSPMAAWIHAAARRAARAARRGWRARVWASSDKGISPLNSLLHARQEMFDNVYWHHTNRAMMAMLLRAVQEALLAERARRRRRCRPRRRLAAGAARRRQHARRRHARWWTRCAGAGPTKCCWRSARAPGSVYQLSSTRSSGTRRSGGASRSRWRRRWRGAGARDSAATRCWWTSPSRRNGRWMCWCASRAAAGHAPADDLDGGDRPARRATSASTSSTSAASASSGPRGCAKRWGAGGPRWCSRRWIASPRFRRAPLPQPLPRCDGRGEPPRPHPRPLPVATGEGSQARDARRPRAGGGGRGHATGSGIEPGRWRADRGGMGRRRSGRRRDGEAEWRSLALGLAGEGVATGGGNLGGGGQRQEGQRRVGPRVRGQQHTEAPDEAAMLGAVARHEIEDAAGQARGAMRQLLDSIAGPARVLLQQRRPGPAEVHGVGEDPGQAASGRARCRTRCRLASARAVFRWDRWRRRRGAASRSGPRSSRWPGCPRQSTTPGRWTRTGVAGTRSRPERRRGIRSQRRGRTAP